MNIQTDYDAFRAAARMPVIRRATGSVDAQAPDVRDDDHEVPLGAPGEFTPGKPGFRHGKVVDPAVPVDPVDPVDPTDPMDASS